MLLTLALACTGDTSTVPVDTGTSATTGTLDSGDSGTETEVPPPVATIHPREPWPDSPLWVETDAGEPDHCTWTVDGTPAEATACRLLGEELGLTPGQELVVVGHFGEAESQEDQVMVQVLPTLLVTESMGGTLAVVDSATKQRLHTLTFDGAFPMPIVAVVDGADVWVSLHVEQVLVRVDAATWTVQETLDVATPVYWMDHDPVRGELLVTDQGEDRLLRIAGSEVTAMDLPAPPVSVRVHGDHAWVAGRTGGSPEVPEDSGFVPEGYVSRLDLATGELVSVSLGHEPYWAEPSPSGDRVAVADQYTDEVVVIDAETLGVLATHPVPGGPTGLAWSSDGTELYAALYSEALVIRFDATTGEELHRWDLGVGAVGIFPRSDGRWLYVPVLHENAVAFIDTENTASDYTPILVPGFSGPRGVTLIP
jgi:YVTN family beta-propeller protein